MANVKYILLVGGAGSGKTWTLKKIIRTLALNKLGKIGLFCYHRNEKVVVVGKYDGSTFEGSDRLSMALMRDLNLFKAFVVMEDFRFVIAEGDRFTNSTYINGVKPTVIKILDDGSSGRVKRGSNQTDRQIKSIATRVKNIRADFEVKDSKEAYTKIVSLL